MRLTHERWRSTAFGIALVVMAGCDRPSNTGDAAERSAGGSTPDESGDAYVHGTFRTDKPTTAKHGSATAAAAGDAVISHVRAMGDWRDSVVNAFGAVMDDIKNYQRTRKLSLEAMEALRAMLNEAGSAQKSAELPFKRCTDDLLLAIKVPGSKLYLATCKQAQAALQTYDQSVQRLSDWWSAYKASDGAPQTGL